MRASECPKFTRLMASYLLMSNHFWISPIGRKIFFNSFSRRIKLWELKHKNLILLKGSNQTVFTSVHLSLLFTKLGCIWEINLSKLFYMYVLVTKLLVCGGFGQVLLYNDMFHWTQFHVFQMDNQNVYA